MGRRTSRNTTGWSPVKLGDHQIQFSGVHQPVSVGWFQIQQRQRHGRVQTPDPGQSLRNEHHTRAGEGADGELGRLLVECASSNT